MSRRRGQDRRAVPAKQPRPQVDGRPSGWRTIGELERAAATLLELRERLVEKGGRS